MSFLVLNLRLIYYNFILLANLSIMYNNNVDKLTAMRNTLKHTKNTIHLK